MILHSSKGKVLIIDEAYMLGSSSSTEGNDATPDPFRAAVVDTIVSKVHNIPGDDRCVLLLGYEAQMEAMFQQVNPGFSRRFPLEDAFHFDAFDEDELRRILHLKLKDQDLTATSEGATVALEVLARERNMMNFGNAGAVENLLSRAKINRQQRIDPGDNEKFELGPSDFDPDHARATSAGTRLVELFMDTVGCETLIAKLRQYQLIALNVKAAGHHIEDHVPFNFIFKGPPGIGKTSTARKVGQVYYDMGLLQRVEVLECSTSDLIGQYVGHTGIKTRRKLEKALGKVLFVDEAYRLTEGHFATEAVNELTDLLTKPQFKGKLVVVLAGYEDQMDEMMSVNPGLASRFPETITFEALTSKQCMGILAKQIQQNGLSCPSFEACHSAEALEVHDIFERMIYVRSWGNARDVQSIGQKIMRHIFGREHTSDELPSVVPHTIVVDCLNKELNQRIKIQSQAERNDRDKPTVLAPSQIKGLMRVPPSAAITPTVKTQQQPLNNSGDGEIPSDSRDSGVSDAVWERLQADIVAAAQRQRDNAATLRTLNKKSAHVAQAFQHADEEFLEQRKAVIEDKEEDCNSDDSDSKGDKAAEARRRLLTALETARLKRQRILQEQERLEQESRREMYRQEKERKQEAVVQKRLREIGVCYAGFHWIKQADGYRCTGGTHFVDNIDL